MRILAALALALALGPWAGAAQAHDFEVGNLHLDHPWIPETPPGAPTAAGYLKISNRGDTVDRLLEVRGAFAQVSEIHEMKIDDAGTMQMRALPDGLEIPAGATVELARGGYHLMFMHVFERPVDGDMIPVTLVFEQAGETEVFFIVQAAGSAGMDDHMHMENAQ